MTPFKTPNSWLHIQCFTAEWYTRFTKKKQRRSNNVMKINSICHLLCHRPKTYNLKSHWEKERRSKTNRRKTTTQRRVEGQTKSCVTNNVLPIPREIYFSGYAVFTLRNDILRFTPSSSSLRSSVHTAVTSADAAIVFRKQKWTQTEAQPRRRRPTKDLTFLRKPWESNFFTGSNFFRCYCCCALFSHEFKARNRRKVNLETLLSQLPLKSHWLSWYIDLAWIWHFVSHQVTER